MAIEIEECRIEHEKRMNTVSLQIQKMEDDIGSLQVVLKNQSDMLKDIQSLSKSVAVLANNMDGLLKEQQRQNQRLSVLEEKPHKKFDMIFDTIIKLIVSAAITIVLVKIGLN